MDRSKEGEDGVVFFEKQFMGMRWVWVMMGMTWFLIVGWFGLLMWGFLRIDTDVSMGEGVVVGTIMFGMVAALLLTLFIPWFMARTRMEVTIDREKIHIYLWPWYRREFDVKDIVGARARECKPFREFGSFGARRVRRWGFAYLVRGNRGADVTMTDGKHLFIGSQKAEELAKVLEQIMPLREGGK